jgi:hypothetical protein
VHTGKTACPGNDFHFLVDYLLLLHLGFSVKYPENISLFVWLIWLIPMLSGMILGSDF